MTLNTNVYIHDPVDIDALFLFGQSLVSDGRDVVEWADEEAWRAPGMRSRYNRLGQGLCAIWDVSYRADGQPLRPDAAAHDPDICDDICDGKWHQTAHWVEVDFDTAYSYSDEKGRNCGGLHAELVAQLGRWLDERGISWSWENEFTSEVHGGPDKYERLADVLGGSAEARSWFLTRALPAIVASAVTE